MRKKEIFRIDNGPEPIRDLEHQIGFLSSLGIQIPNTLHLSVRAREQTIRCMCEYIGTDPVRENRVKAIIHLQDQWIDRDVQRKEAQAHYAPYDHCVFLGVWRGLDKPKTHPVEFKIVIVPYTGSTGKAFQKRIGEFVLSPKDP